MKRFQGLDKGTIAAVALLLTVVLAGWQLIAQQQDVAAKRHQIDALISNAKQADHDAAKDRATAAANQRRLLDYTKALAARQDDLLAYLRGHGIQLPARYVTSIPAPRIVVTHRVASRHHSGHRRTPHRVKHRTRPSGPGKSSRAPGHRKHHHHGHGHGHGHRGR